MIDKSKEYPYSGIPTFMKSEYGSFKDLRNFQVGVFGVPCDTGTSNRFGTRLGPSAIRTASTWYNPQSNFSKGSLIDLYQKQKEISIEIPKILDLGDVTVYPTDFRKTLDCIEEFSYKVSRVAFPIILGGDHTLSYPAIKGTLKGLQEKENISELGIIHFDSHIDTWESFITLDKMWHGSPFRNLIEENIIKGSNIVMIGHRQALSIEDYNFIKTHKIRLYSISDIWEKGISTIVNEAAEYLNKNTDGIYISLDIDALDPSFAPGTGTPEPGGLSSREMIEAFNIICESVNIKGMDLVEVAPNLDPTENTQNLAAFFLNRVLTLYQGF